MAAISMFYGLVIYLYQYDNIRHHFPHIHVKYQGEWAVFSILDGNVLEGELKLDKAKLVQAWIVLLSPDTVYIDSVHFISKKNMNMQI